MGSKRDKLLALLDTDNLTPSLAYWCDILIFAENNKNFLDITDMEIICAESERVRDYYNGPRTYTEIVFRNGKETELKLAKTPLDIKKEEVAPNVYQILEEKIEEERRLEEAREEREKTRTYKETPEPMAIPIPLAAAPG